jgi:hypothetical protein
MSQPTEDKRFRQYKLMFEHYVKRCRQLGRASQRKSKRHSPVFTGELGNRQGDTQNLAADLARLRSQVGTISSDTSRQVGVAVQDLQRSIGEVQRDLIGRLGASEQRLSGIMSDQISASRLELQTGLQADLTLLRQELADRGDQQAQQLAGDIATLQDGLRSTNVQDRHLPRSSRTSDNSLRLP